MLMCEWLRYLAGREPRGRKVLLTMFARQVFPTAGAKERNR
jgi:hypothetical protein